MQRIDIGVVADDRPGPAPRVAVEHLRRRLEPGPSAAEGPHPIGDGVLVAFAVQGLADHRFARRAVLRMDDGAPARHVVNRLGGVPSDVRVVAGRDDHVVVLDVPGPIAVAVRLRRPL